MSTTVKDTGNSKGNIENLTKDEQSLVAKRRSFFEDKTVVNQDETETFDGGTNETELQANSMFIVCVDGTPKFYTKTIENARVKMWDTAGQLLWESSPEYNCYIRNTNQNNIKVIGYSKIFLVSYDRVLHDIVITKIPSLD